MEDQLGRFNSFILAISSLIRFSLLLKNIQKPRFFEGRGFSIGKDLGIICQLFNNIIIAAFLPKYALIKLMMLWKEDPDYCKVLFQSKMSLTILYKKG